MCNGSGRWWLQPRYTNLKLKLFQHGLVAISHNLLSVGRNYSQLNKRTITWFTRKYITYKLLCHTKILSWCKAIHLKDGDVKSMGWCKKDVAPLLTHWSYVLLALTHRNDVSAGSAVLFDQWKFPGKPQVYNWSFWRRCTCGASRHAVGENSSRRETQVYEH